MSGPREGVVDIYVGVVCGGDPVAGGWGVLLRCGDHEKEISGGESPTTVGRVALAASTRALESLNRSCVVRIHVDDAGVRAELTAWLSLRRTSGPQAGGEEQVADAELWRRLQAAMKSHDVSWCWPQEHAASPFSEHARRLAGKALRDVVVQRRFAEDGDCVHEMPARWCAYCKAPPPGVLPHGYRTEAGDAYHNDRHCTWMHRGQRRAERQGKNVHAVVRVAWADVRLGELAPCEACCTSEWVRRHQR